MATAKAAFDKQLENLRRPSNETIVDFSPEVMKAPFALRVAALSVDYLLFLLLPVLWLVLARFLSDTGTPDGIGNTVWFVGFLLLIGNSVLLPLVNGQSLGKMIFGMHICKIDGSRADMFSMLKRNVPGYILTLLSGGLGFIWAAINGKGRALHDYIAGTIVVRGRKNRIESGEWRIEKG